MQSKKKFTNTLWLEQKTICTFPILMGKLYILQELFSFKAVKGVPFHAKFNENNIYFPHNPLNILMLHFHCYWETGYHFACRYGNNSYKKMQKRIAHDKIGNVQKIYFLNNIALTLCQHIYIKIVSWNLFMMSIEKYNGIHLQVL